MEHYPERTCVEIDLGAAMYNMESMHRNLKNDIKMTAVIKTNAYGHGAEAIAHTLEPLPYLWGFAVATADEAYRLRDSGITRPILILGYVFPQDWDKCIERGIRMAAFCRDDLPLLDIAARKAGKKAQLHIAVDTGMSRIGVTPDDAGIDFVRSALMFEHLNVEGIFTHFAKADEEGSAPTEHQYSLFSGFTDRIEKELDFRVPIRHCDNSAGIISYPQNSMDMVRAGVTLYGMWPSSVVPKDIVPLKPVLSWYSHVAYVKIIHAGTSVSYGGTFTAQHDMRIATVPVGYGDGYPRSLSNKGYVLIRGRKAPILGRVCMDQMMVDVSNIEDTQRGDTVTLVGQDGNEQITMEDLGSLSGRFNYELACDINARVPRVYKNDKL